MSKWEKSLGESDEWYTPPEVFDALGCDFDMDVAAPVNRTAGEGDCGIKKPTYASRSIQAYQSNRLHGLYGSILTPEP